MNTLKKLVPLILSMLMVCSIAVPALAATGHTYCDCTEAYQDLNQIRLSKDAWYYNTDNTRVINKSGTLKPLKRSAELERVAKVRAKELVQQFDHTRPNGKSCFTVYPMDKLRNAGENIASGFDTAKEMTESLKEHRSFDRYDTQGHCRNMLNSHYTHVGIACYTDQYGKKYWVQAFGEYE